ncbi:MAG TPA: mechanosensitive ion channel family protein, partial [Dehalococcoidia bacterium]|nr:mechanosensitive ion channel family protein [Dehalococcoidia bacterium]
EVAGLVEDLSLRRTVLRDLDGVVHSVPNGDVRVASNFTREWSRVNLNVGVAYGEDVDHVMEVMNRVGRELAEDPAWAPLILTPPQALGVDYLSDTAVEIKMLGDTRPIRQWEVMGELRKRLKEAFDREDIKIRASQQGLIRQLAFPQRGRPEGRA